MIGAGEGAGLTAVLGHLGAAMPANVEERTQLPVPGAGDDDRHPAGARGEERSRPRRLPRVADVLPRRAEDQLLLTAQELGIGVPAIRKRVLD